MTAVRNIFLLLPLKQNLCIRTCRYFSVVMRSVAGYVTNNNKKRERKVVQKELE